MGSCQNQLGGFSLGNTLECLWSFWIFKLLSCKGLIVNLTLSLNTLCCHILICKVSLTYVQVFLSYKRLKFSRFSGFDSFPWDFRGNFFSRNALLVTPNAHTKFHQNRLMGQFSMEVLTTSLVWILGPLVKHNGWKNFH